MRWTGSQWVILDAANNSNSGAYMDALADILSDTTSTGTFKTAFIKNLFASTIQAEVVNVLMKLMVGSGTDGILIDGQNELIKSANYATGSAGFKLDSDGNAEFNNGTFRGRIEANGGSFEGTLNAKYINITGTVNAGDNYLLRKNNSVIQSKKLSGFTLLKSIITFARGSCRIKVSFSQADTSSVAFGGSYFILVNGNQVSGGNVSDNPVIIDVSINQSINTIDLYGRGQKGGIIDLGFQAETFELWTSDDPGMLVMLGT